MKRSTRGSLLAVMANVVYVCVGGLVIRYGVWRLGEVGEVALLVAFGAGLVTTMIRIGRRYPPR